MPVTSERELRKRLRAVRSERRLRIPIAGVAGPATPRERWALAGILVAAIALRVWGLATFPLDQDELYTAAEARDLWHVALWPGIHARPAFFLLQHALLWIVPPTPLGLRAAPFLFGVLGVAAVWMLARRVFGPAAALSAAVLVSLSPWHLFESGFARYWSLLFLLGALFPLALWEAYGRGRNRDFAVALAVLAVGTATHPSFVFPAAGAALGVTLVRADGRLGWRWPSRRAWVRLWLPYAALLVAGWFALKLTGHGGAMQNWSGRGIDATLRLIPAIAEWLGPAVAVAAVLGAAAALASADAGRRRWGMMAACGGGVTLAALLFAATRTDVYADYAVAMLPLAFVSAGGLVASITERMTSGRAWAAAAATAVVCAAMLPATASQLSSGTRFDYRPAFAYLRRHAQGNTVMAWPAVIADHYAADLRPRELRMQAPILDRTLAESGELWIVASVQRYGMLRDDDGAVTAWLARHCTAEASFEHPRWDYRIYRVVVHRCVAARR
jgi:hypothetical protein